MAKVKWVPTTEAIEALGVGRWTLYNTLRPKLKNTSPLKVFLILFNIFWTRCGL